MFVVYLLQNMKMIKRLMVVVIVVLLAVAVWTWYKQCGDVSHHEIKEAVAVESVAIQQRLDERCSKIEQKLDQIENKLDILLELARPKLPDGMTPSE